MNHYNTPFHIKLEQEKFDEHNALDDKYSSVCDYDNGLIPVNQKDRYDIFKNYIANWYFIHYKYDFLELANGRHDIHLLEAHLHKLDKIKKKAKLVTASKKSSFFEAVEYINNLMVHGAGCRKNISDEDAALYIIILYEQNYFESMKLPDEVFGFNDVPKEIIEIPKVYGEYFLLYDYLKKQGKGDYENVRPSRELKDIFLEIHRDKCNKIIDLLSQKNSTIPQCPFIIQDGKKRVWEMGSDAPHSYLAGLFVALKKENWIYQESNAEYMRIARHTFNVAKPSRTAFSDVKIGDVSQHKYIKPFEKLFEQIK